MAPSSARSRARACIAGTFPVPCPALSAGRRAHLIRAPIIAAISVATAVRSASAVHE